MLSSLLGLFEVAVNLRRAPCIDDREGLDDVAGEVAEGADSWFAFASSPKRKRSADVSILQELTTWAGPRFVFATLKVNGRPIAHASSLLSLFRPAPSTIPLAEVYRCGSPQRSAFGRGSPMK